MPIDLTTLGETPPVRAQLPIGELIARPGFAPRSWQTKAPEELFTGHKPPVGDSDDLRRVIALPRRPQVHKGDPRGEAMIQMMNARLKRVRTTPCRCHVPIAQGGLGRACIDTLNLTQALALFEIGIVGGLLGPIGVGHGKTILGLLAPLAVRGCRTAVLLMPTNLVRQLTKEYELLAEHWRVPSLISHSIEYNAIVPGEPVLHVLPYQRLQLPKSSVKLEEIAPDTIIMDECHKVRHRDTSTSSRVLKYADRHPDTHFLAWSGSMSNGKLENYAHISALSLGLYSPLPTEPSVVADWARAIDPSDWPAPPGALVALCAEGEHVQEGYHRRLVETRGVVATTTGAIDAELIIQEQPAPEIPDEVRRALTDLRDSWTRPDGEELIDALSVGRCARELACGFYYRWKFIHGETVSEILAWLDARRDYRKELRELLKERADHLDSPHLCELAAKRHHGDIGIPTPPPCPVDRNPAEWEAAWMRAHPIWPSLHWPRWRDIKNTVRPITEAVWLSEYLAQDAANWALANHGIIWYESGALGTKISKLSGLTKHGGGPDAERLIAEETGKTSIICSIKSHGTGRDGLQKLFYDQLVPQPMSSADGWEQLLGRLHRIGQPKPTVRARFYRHTPELAACVDKSLARAVNVMRTLGSVQKLQLGFELPEVTDVTTARGKPDPLGLYGITEELDEHFGAEGHHDSGAGEDNEEED